MEKGLILEAVCFLGWHHFAPSGPFPTYPTRLRVVLGAQTNVAVNLARHDLQISKLYLILLTYRLTLHFIPSEISFDKLLTTTAKLL